MARRLGTERNTLKIQDNISGSDLEIYYRNPTTEERIAYSNESIRRKRNRVEFQTAKARQKWGKKIMTGFRDGDFEIPEGRKYVPIASDPKSSNYRENWKDLVATYAMDVIETLAAYVFDTSTEIIDETDDEEEKDDNASPDDQGDKDFEDPEKN